MSIGCLICSKKIRGIRSCWIRLGSRSISLLLCATQLAAEGPDCGRACWQSRSDCIQKKCIDLRAKQILLLATWRISEAVASQLQLFAAADVPIAIEIRTA